MIRKRGSDNDDDSFAFFIDLPHAIQFHILHQLWNQNHIREVLNICHFFNHKIHYFCKTFPNPHRGGVIGELLQLSYPKLRKTEFPFLSYMVLMHSKSYPWNWTQLSLNPSITWKVVQATPRHPWNYTHLSRNPSITWDVVQANPGKNWIWRALSANPSITLDIIQSNPDHPWDWTVISANPSISWEMVQANFNEPWDWFVLYCRFPISWKILHDNPTIPKINVSEIQDSPIKH